MNDWSGLKKRARDWHDLLVNLTGGDPSAGKLLEAAVENTGIDSIPCDSEDPLLMGAEAVYDPDSNLIYYDQGVDNKIAVFNQMHEYAHFHLHNDECFCDSNDFDMEASEEDASIGIGRVDAYNPKERMEREANVFAREVLLPSPKLHQWFLEDGKSASDIADFVGVHEGMVLHQLSFSILVSDISVETDYADSKISKPDLDDSQRVVAEWEKGPLLVEAGPGTGKTRALIGRAEFLLKKGIPPASILALTFSNKAAEEMRFRLSLADPDASPHIWMGTFHAFALELLRKYGSHVGIEPDFEVIDAVDATLLLEKHLPSLTLNHYRNLYEPSIFLPDILSTISRAKDELVGPDKYLEFATKMIDTAKTEEDFLSGEKAIDLIPCAFVKKF